MESITVGIGPATVTFCDERARAPHQVPAGSVVSVTLDGEDSSWGEFMTREDALQVLGWLGALVAFDPQIDPLAARGGA